MNAPANRFAISLNDIRLAETRIAPYVLKTPTIHSESLSQRTGCEVYFKAENLQYVGAFKARGAINAVLCLDDEAAHRGVITHSSGNHAAALARAARLRGIPAHVVMPENSSPRKIASVKSYGITPVFCEPSTPAREAMTDQLQRQTGATLVHPFESPAVIAGQGTVGLEILTQLDRVDAILVPVGGGGLLAGVLMAVKSLRPEVKVYAVEPEFADDTARSLQAGSPQLPLRYDTVADGLRTQVGSSTFQIIKSMLDDIFLVSEDLILQSMRTIAEEAHLVCEPSGAVAFAGLMNNADRFVGKNVVSVISGGNVNMDRCGLGKSG